MTKSADKRTVHTDALATLGTLELSPNEGRDAIHLGVEPVVAGERLKPGQHVGFLKHGTVGRNAPTKVGIVDPFIDGPIPRGARFWLVVYPRQITSLRHVWTHPDFPHTPDLPPSTITPKAQAEARIASWAEDIGSNFDEVMEHAGHFARFGDYWSEGARWEGQSVPDWFWADWAVITGEPIPDEVKQYGGSFFSCSC